jgi:hypothetical protein
MTRQELAELAREINFGTRRQAIILYSLISPLTRSSIPALYYPVIFPRRHDFYGPDFGQDIFGIGLMPDDNRVVWNYLNPKLPGGAMIGPYQFSLYSQVGTAWAIVWSAALGFLLSLVWMFTQNERVRRPWNVLLGSMVILFGAYLGIDSIRDSLLVSYGVIWGVLFVGSAAGLVAILQRVPRVHTPPAVAGTPVNQPSREP